MLIPVVTGS